MEAGLSGVWENGDSSRGGDNCENRIVILNAITNHHAYLRKIQCLNKEWRWQSDKKGIK